MSWINDLFSKRKIKEQANLLVTLASSSGIISQEELQVLRNDAPYLSKVIKLNAETEKSITSSDKEQFQIMHFLIKTLMSNGNLSAQKLEIIKKLLLTLKISEEKTNDLIGYMVTNIRDGLSRNDSYIRVGYLFDPRFTI